MRYCKATFFFLAVVLLFAAGAIAQDISATISGEVKDPQGLLIAKAKITVINTDKNIVIKTLDTDGKGAFVVPDLQVGHYTVTVTAQGFETFEQKDIDLHASDRFVIHAQLAMGGVTEKVTVESARV